MRTTVLTALLLFFCLVPAASATVLLDGADAGIAQPDAGYIADRPPPPPPPPVAKESLPHTGLNQGGLTALASALVVGLTHLFKRRRLWRGLAPGLRPFLPLLLGAALSAAAGVADLVPADVAAVSAALSGAAGMGFYQLGKRRRREL